MYDLISFTDEKEYVALFTGLNMDLYKNDPQWIPESKEEMESLITGQHPCSYFLKNRNFILLKSGRVSGRLTAFVNLEYQCDDGPLGSIGCFEFENDREAAGIAAGAAFEWLREQGVNTVWGPMNGSIWLKHRLMVEGFEGPVFYGEPNNKPYYKEIFEGLGFSVMKKWSSTISLERKQIENITQKVLPRYENAMERGYGFREVDMNHFEEEFSLLHSLISDSFSGFLGFHPIGQRAFIKMCEGFRLLYRPGFMHFAFAPDNTPIGFCIFVPDIADAVKNSNCGRTKVSNYIGLYIGITHEAMEKHRGIGGALFYLGMRSVARAGASFSFCLLAQDAYSNSYTRDNYTHLHRYELYRKKL